MEEQSVLPEEKKLPAPEEKLSAPEKPPADLPAESQQRLLEMQAFARKYRKYFWVIPVLLIIILALLIFYNLTAKKTRPVAVVQILAPTQAPPTPLPSPTVDPIAGWGTYNGDGFSFHYPPGMSLETKSVNEVDGNLSVADGSLIFGTIYMQNLPFPTPVVGKIFQHLTNEAPVSGVEKSILTVDNQQIENYIIGCEAADCQEQFSYFNNKGKYYEMKFDIAGGGLSRLASQILSTFKFMDQTGTIDTSTWKTISAFNNSFSFKYPSDWTQESKNVENNTLDVKLTYAVNDKAYYLRVSPGGSSGPPADRLENESVSYYGIQFIRRSWIKDGKIFFVSLIPEKNNVPFNHIEMALPPEGTDQYLQVFNQIISTFKFPGQTQSYF